MKNEKNKFFFVKMKKKNKKWKKVKKQKTIQKMKKNKKSKTNKKQKQIKKHLNWKIIFFKNEIKTQKMKNDQGIRKHT